jgi:glyoxylase-like metal-dependent hydrolase (beta-lactamase superfamily II)
VHLDHAGGSGLLMRELPHATLVVHPRGARHLIDPRALYQGALAIYGRAEMDRSYGTLVGVDAARVVTTHDGMVLELAGRPLAFADTAGHARHHHCIWDAATRGWFTGDTFGLSYREFDNAGGEPAVLPATTPVGFEPEALHASVRRLLSFDAECVYVTHFGRVGGVARLASMLLGLVDAMVEIGLRLRDAPDRHMALMQALERLYTDRLRRHGVTLPAVRLHELLAVDVDLNAQGLALWLDRTPKP